MLGFQRRGVRRCECDTLLPKPGPLPHTSQTEATGSLHLDGRQTGLRVSVWPTRSTEGYPTAVLEREPVRPARAGTDGGPGPSREEYPAGMAAEVMDGEVVRHWFSLAAQA